MKKIKTTTSGSKKPARLTEKDLQQVTGGIMAAGTQDAMKK